MRSLWAVAACFAIACAPASNDGEVQEALTDIPQTAVKRQQVGNCWIFATSAWVESLAYGEGGVASNVSEAYLTYHSWMRAIRMGRLVESDDDSEPSIRIATGGYAGEALELMRRYGLMSEADFGVTTDDTARAKREIEAELSPGGALDTARARTRERVRTVLDRAFRVSPQVKSAMTRAFGDDLSRTIPDGADLPPSITAPSEIRVGKDGGRVITLEDAIGKPIGGDELVSHEGPYAWADTVVGVDEALEDTVLRLKETLNQGFPVPISWVVDRDYRSPDDGSFQSARIKRTDSELGYHESLIDDYEVTLPSGKTLAAGKVERRQQLLDEALDGRSKIQFLRVKNSWGFVSKSGIPQGEAGSRGYIDLAWKYLLPSRSEPRVTRFTLPPPRWRNVTRLH